MTISFAQNPENAARNKKKKKKTFTPVNFIVCKNRFSVAQTSGG